jgi:hypothetical protein
MLGMPTLAEADKSGSFYPFEKGPAKTVGRKGFADSRSGIHYLFLPTCA